MARTVAKFLDKTLGVKCVACEKRVNVDTLHGCSKCGSSYCQDCTDGNSDSRICPPCKQEVII